MAYKSIKLTIESNSDKTLVAAPGAAKHLKLDSILVGVDTACSVEVLGDETSIIGPMFCNQGGGFSHSLVPGSGISLPPNTALKLAFTDISGSTKVGGAITYSIVG